MNQAPLQADRCRGPEPATLLLAMSETKITTQGLEDLKTRLVEMEGPMRQEIADRILVARGYGDLSENAEYHAAKDDQAHHETAILRLREKIQTAVIIDEAPSDGTVGFGSTVTYEDQSTSKQQTFKLVASHEAKPAEGTLSAESPIATALSGAKAGEEVTANLPSGPRKLTVISVS